MYVCMYVCMRVYMCEPKHIAYKRQPFFIFHQIFLLSGRQFLDIRRALSQNVSSKRVDM